MPELAEGDAVQQDWTQDDSGRSNSSETFRLLIHEVARIIRDGAHSLLVGDAEQVARTILATLAHTHGFGPEATEMAKVIADHDAARELGRCDGLLRP